MSPSAGTTIFRTEERTDAGNGFADSVSFNSEDNTFTVNNLAFDGDSPYVRGTAVSSLNNGRFAVYEAEQQATDPVTGAPITQFVYRAIYGVSKNRTQGDNPVATTQFAIIRTGNYIPYGFGGFIYQRDESVTLPAQLQAAYSESAAGLRDFNTKGGLQYTTSDVSIDIDIDDFDTSSGVKGQVTNRKVFDLNGVDVTADVAEEASTGATTLPPAVFTVGPGVLAASGDVVGEITSTFTAADGSTTA